MRHAAGDQFKQVLIFHTKNVKTQLFPEKKFEIFGNVKKFVEFFGKKPASKRF